MWENSIIEDQKSSPKMSAVFKTKLLEDRDKTSTTDPQVGYYHPKYSWVDADPTRAHFST